MTDLETRRQAVEALAGVADPSGAGRSARVRWSIRVGVLALAATATGAALAMPRIAQWKQELREARDCAFVGHAALQSGELGRAEGYFARALELCDGLREESASAHLRAAMGRIRFLRGDLDGAQAFFARALPVARREKSYESCLWIAEFEESRGNHGLAKELREIADAAVREAQLRVVCGTR